METLFRGELADPETISLYILLRWDHKLLMWNNFQWVILKIAVQDILNDKLDNSIF